MMLKKSLQGALRAKAQELGIGRGLRVDVARGEVFLRSLNATSQLCLASYGHLAVRIDEFPAILPTWPMTDTTSER